MCPHSTHQHGDLSSYNNSVIQCTDLSTRTTTSICIFLVFSPLIVNKNSKRITGNSNQHVHIVSFSNLWFTTQRFKVYYSKKGTSTDCSHFKSWDQICYVIVVLKLTKTVDYQNSCIFLFFGLNMR